MKVNAIVDLHSSDVPSTAYTNYKQYLKSFCVLQYHYDDQHDNTDVSKTFFQDQDQDQDLNFKTKTKPNVQKRNKNEIGYSFSAEKRKGKSPDNISVFFFFLFHTFSH